jgi:hypothetical protein
MSLNRPAAQRPGGREMECAENVCVCVRACVCVRVFGDANSKHTRVLVYFRRMVSVRYPKERGEGGGSIFV